VESVYGFKLEGLSVINPRLHFDRSIPTKGRFEPLKSVRDRNLSKDLILGRRGWQFKPPMPCSP